MPHSTSPVTQHIQVTQLAPTFGAEVTGVDFSQPVPAEVFQEILDAITKHGVLVFRKAGLDDARHVEFSRLFGELDDVKPYLTLGRTNRFPFDELFDVSNQEDDGSLVEVGSKRDHQNKGNSLFHVDSSFNPRRAGFSLLRAHALPPPGHGGNTDFADTRTAYDDLPPALQMQLHENDSIGAHSLWHSRKKACPESPWLKDFDPEAHPYGRHRILQRHERSGRWNLYVANHLHHLEYPPPPSSASVEAGEGRRGEEGYVGERVPESESIELIETLLRHATQDKYVLSVEWKEEGDLVVWDNTCVMHRAGQGTFAGKFKRDMRRTTVHDSSTQAWGLNEKVDKRMGMP